MALSLWIKTSLSTSQCVLQSSRASRALAALKMEVVGIAASLITLLGVTRKLSTDAKEISKAFKKAPAEIMEVVEEVSNVGSTLDQIHSLLLGIEDDYEPPSDLRMGFEQALNQCDRALKRLGKVCRLEKDGARFRQRLNWALIERKQVDQAKKQIGRAERHLLLLMHSLTM